MWQAVEALQAAYLAELLLVAETAALEELPAELEAEEELVVMQETVVQEGLHQAHFRVQAVLAVVVAVAGAPVAEAEALVYLVREQTVLAVLAVVVVVAGVLAEELEVTQILRQVGLSLTSLCSAAARPVDHPLLFRGPVAAAQFVSSGPAQPACFRPLMLVHHKEKSCW